MEKNTKINSPLKAFFTFIKKLGFQLNKLKAREILSKKTFTS